MAAPAALLLAAVLALTWVTSAPAFDAGADSAAAHAADLTVAPPPVEWLTFREAKTVARRSESPLMVYFTTARSRPAAQLDRETWTDPELRGYLSEHLVTARVDVQDQPSVGELFDINEIPSLLFLAPDGRRLVVLRGFNGPEAVLRVATYIATRAYEFTEYETWKSRQPDR